MIITTATQIEDKKIVDTLGIVRGTSVRGKDFFQDIGSDIKNIFGGKLGAFKKLTDECIDQAYAEMKETAEKAGGDAIIGLRIEPLAVPTSKDDTGIGIVVYGTVVKLEDK